LARRKIISPAQIQKDALRAWLDKLPPETSAAAILAGTAALAGFTPPFTRLLMMTGAASGSSNKDYHKDFAHVFEVLSPQFLIINWLFGPSDSSSTSLTPPIPAEQLTYSIGLFAAAALEGAMMYNAMKNPEVLTTLIKAPAEILKGVGEIVPG